MSSPTIFYSWQSDLPAATTRNFIANALSAVVEGIDSHPQIVDSPRLDQDTSNISGTPEIAGTIFRKIEQAAVFAADVSISCTTSNNCPNTKYSPNANVMLETGYAAARLGWDRIILVMNGRFGGPTKLPFDLKNRRWPVSFSATDSNYDAIHGDFITRLKEQIVMCLASDYVRAEDALSQLAPHARRIIRDWAHSQAFNDGKPENTFLSRDDYHTQQMINLGLIRCVPDSSDFRSQMTWTYLGRECCRRLGFALPAETAMQLEAPPNVFADMSEYDQFSDAGES